MGHMHHPYAAPASNLIKANHEVNAQVPDSENRHNFCQKYVNAIKNRVTDMGSRSIKIVDLKDWKPPKQSLSTSVPIGGWSTSVLLGSMTL